MTNVLLIDDHTLFRTGIKLLLQRSGDFNVVGEAADGLEGVKRAKQLNPDVVLLDLHMPGINGLEALQLILQDHPGRIVLMLTVSEDADDLTQALKAGAHGYLLKNIEAEELISAIKRALAGEAVVSSAMTNKLVKQMRASTPSVASVQEKEKLTPRELEILAGLAKGESNKEIARRFDIAESTVKIHVQNILKKLELNSRVQAAIYALEHKLI
ncbi:MAG TPA: response regulator transcription factor [Pseudomonadales bacterium]|nr:response regulator transcription factor [Pseudomonadales bacterium]